MTHASTLFAFLGAAFTLLPSAHADLITWAVPLDTTATSDVSTDGSLVAALNLWGGMTFPVTVNGVTFAAEVPNQWDSGGSTLLSSSSTGDADFDQLLTTARTPFGTVAGNPTGFGAIQLDTLGSLQIGKTYEVQVWYCDQRSGPTRDRVMTLSSASGAVTITGGLADNLGSVSQGPLSLELEADPNNVNGATDTIFGQFCIGTFTRTSNDPLWLLVEGSNPTSGESLRPHVNALQIREVIGGIGTAYCTAAQNSTGSTAALSVSGTLTTSLNDITLNATGLPTNSFGFFIVSQTQGFVANPGGSAGNLCLGGAVGRYVGPGQIQNSGGAGAFDLQIDLTAIPSPTGPVQAMAGDTWNFQTWYRDSSPAGPTSNFTQGVEVVLL